MTQQTIKARLHELCRQLVQRRITTAREAMEAAQAAANNEGKSSAGDKYETGRAMMQLERDQHARSLAEALKLQQLLDGLAPAQVHEQVRPGSLVKSTTGHYYVSISLGRLELDGTDYIAISAATPLGRQLMGKSVGDVLSFNQKKITILEIE